MAEMLVPNDGVRGIDIETPSGAKKKLNADSSGRVVVNDPKLAKSLREQGFTDAGVSFSIGNYKKVDICPKCDGSKFADQKVCAPCHFKELEEMGDTTNG